MVQKTKKTGLQGYVWHSEAYAIDISESTKQKFNEFIEACRKDLSRESNKCELSQPNAFHIYIAGEEWSIEQNDLV